MVEKSTVILRNYNEQTILAKFEVEKGSSLYMCDTGIINLTTTGKSEQIYTHKSRYLFLGVTTDFATIHPTCGVGDTLEITSDSVTLCVVEGAKINGQWELTEFKEKILNSFNYWSDFFGDVLLETPIPHITESINFERDGVKYEGFDFWYASAKADNYYQLDYAGSQVDTVWSTTENGVDFWVNNKVLDINFGEDIQIMNRAFYEWFVIIADDLSTRYDVTIKSFDGDTIIFKDRLIGPTDIYVTSQGVADEKGNYLYTHSRPKVFLGLSEACESSVPTYERGDRVQVDRNLILYISEGTGSSHYIVKASTIEEIADAIRYKTGQSGPIKLKDFASEIMKILDLATDDDIDELVESILEEE